MVRQVRETRIVSETDPYRPWIGNLAKPLLIGVGAVAAVLVYYTASNASSRSYNVSATDAGCVVKYINAPNPAGGRTVSIEASLSCAKPPSSVHLALQLQYRTDSGKPWTDVGTQGLVDAPPGKIANVNYLWAEAPCQVGDFQASYMLSGTAKATAQPFTEPVAASDSRTIGVGECQVTTNG